MNLRTESNIPWRRQLVKLSNDQFLLLLLRCLTFLPTVHSVTILDDVDNLLIFPQINLHYHSLAISLSLCHLFQDFPLWHCLLLGGSTEEFKMPISECLYEFIAIRSKNFSC